MSETVSGRDHLERLLELEVAQHANLTAVAIRGLVARGVDSVAGFLGVAESAPADLADELQIEPDKLLDLAAAAAEAFLTPEERGELLRYEASSSVLGEGQLPLDTLSGRGEAEALAFPPPPPPEPLDSSLPSSVFLEPLPPIRDQGDRFTCTAFATVAVLEAQLYQLGQAMDLSEQFLYWRTKKLDVGKFPNAPHSLLSIAFAAAQGAGVCLEGLWRYDPKYRGVKKERGAQPHNPQVVAKDAAGRKMVQLESFSGAQMINSSRQAIATGQPVAVTLRVTIGFLSNSAFSLGEPIPLPSDQELSQRKRFHSATLVGYNDGAGLGGGYFRLRNSMGPGWGKDGYALLPYEYLSLYGLEAWTGVPG